MSDTCDGNCQGKWYSFRCDDRSIIRCAWCGKPSPDPLPPMPPEVRKLVEWAEGAEEQMESDRGPSKTHPTEGEQIISAVRRIYRSEP